MINLRVRNIEVGARIGEAPKFRIYLGKTDDEQQVILKVAKTFEDGDILAAEAGEFNTIRSFGSEVALFQEKQGGENSHYDWLFANLLTSFMEPTQDDRRINVFTMPDIDLSKLVPLAKLHTDTEIDTRTSIWILGRFFKFYSFFELIAASTDYPITRYPLFSPDDYLIGPERHRLIYYNFTGDIADVVALDFVKATTNFILGWVVTGDDPKEQEYYELLKDFSKLGRASFEEAHRELYELVKKLWGIQYYPFTYRDRDTINWKTIKED